MKDSKHFMEHYKAGKYPSPVTVLSEAPTEDYFLAWARYIYSMYCGGAAYTVPPNLYNKRSVEELRAYARGEQPTTKYKKLVDVCLKDGKVGGTSIESSGSLLNISFDNVRYFPKYRDLCVAKITEPEFEPIIRAMDSQASFERRKQYFIAKLATDPRIRTLAEGAGVTTQTIEKYNGMSQMDVDTASQMGAINLAAESLMGDVSMTTMDRSEWNVIKHLVACDLVDVNYAGVRHVCGPNGVKLEYCDAEGLIFPASKYPDHRDDQFVAEVRRTNIASIRAEYGITEDKLYLIAKSWGGSNNAQSIANFGSRSWREGFASTNGRQCYDHFSIDVMDFYFIASKTEDLLVGAYNNPRAEDNVTEIGGVPYTEDKAAIQYVYKGCWVVGSNIILSSGVDNAIVRAGEQGEKKAKLPIQIWTGDGASVTERCIAAVDDIQMAVLKIRLLIANLPPGPRFAMDMSVLESAIQFGKEAYDMKDMLKMFGATGKLLLRSKSEFEQGGASQKSPIIPIEAGIQEDFAILSNQIAMGLDLIRQSTGMNEIADGSGNPTDVLNGVAKGFQAASNNALRPMVLAMESINLGIYSYVVKKYQSLRLYGPVSISKWTIDANHFSVLALPEDIPYYDFEVKVRALPSQEELQLVLQSLLQKNAEGTVTGADALIVMQMIRDRDVIKAQMYLGRAIALAKERDHAKQLELIKTQTQANAESAMAAEEAKRGTIAAEGEIKMKELEVKDHFDREKGERDGKQRLREIAAEGDNLLRVEEKKIEAMSQKQ